MRFTQIDSGFFIKHTCANTIAVTRIIANIERGICERNQQ